jgi:hypothetical protein
LEAAHARLFGRCEAQRHCGFKAQLWVVGDLPQNRRVLVALDSMRKDPKGEELMFLVRAWNAAFAKAQSLGWLN